MLTESLLAEYRKIQQAAKGVLDELAIQIGPLDTERSLAEKAHAGLRERGFPETWYYRCPAMVLLGSRSCLSISGKDYEPSLEPVGQLNLVTVDLSPSRGPIWGDCARSFYVENGRATSKPTHPEFDVGRRFLAALHAAMPDFARPETTFHELFEWSNRFVAAAGFETLDFLANAGHSIAARREDRLFIQAQNHGRLSEVSLFTFEPHVRATGGCWGFKHENIFYFSPEGRLEEL